MSSIFNEYDYVLNDLQLYREFDMSNFISNAKYSVANKVGLVKTNVELSHYSTMITSVLQNFNSMQIHKEEMISFFSTCSKDVINSITDDVRDITTSDVTTIKPQYLTQFVTNIGLIIDRTIKGEDNKFDIDKLVSLDMTEKVKKQMVKTSLPYLNSPKQLIKIDNSGFRKADNGYVKDTIIPFLKSMDEATASLQHDAMETISTINKCDDEINAYVKTIETINS
jgi:hypothetical protein